MTEYIDLDTGGKLRDKACADQAYAAGHRIRVYSDGVPVTEWVPGSNVFYSYEGGEKTPALLGTREAALDAQPDSFAGAEGGRFLNRPYAERRGWDTHEMRVLRVRE